jgi:pyrimidine operon attenuation protein/uracil phosphoribosyltransferase
MQTLLSNTELNETIRIMVDQLKKKHPSMENVALVGIQQGGVAIADQIAVALKKADPSAKFEYGQLDITFYRDDIRNEILAPDRMNLPFAIEDKVVILIDDVLFTGRTIKAALDVLVDYGRPAKVELCVLVDRKEHRQFPIQADYVGVSFSTNRVDKIKLLKNEQGQKQVVLIPG